jgi:hypothetical protein
VVVVVLVVFTPDHGSKPKGTVLPRIIPGKAVKQFTSTSCLPFRKELITFVHARAEKQCE